MRWNSWWRDLTAGVLVIGFGWYDAIVDDPGGSAGAVFAIVVGLALAAGTARGLPALGFTLLWLVGGCHLLGDVDLMLVEVAAAYVIFCAARYGAAATVWASGLSLPIAFALVVLFVRQHGTELGSTLDLGLGSLSQRPSLVVGSVAGLGLAAPWTLGLVLRLSALVQTTRRAQEEAETQRAEALELARLRDEQARLARDVHDVVGHSLAVILAQAESAGYLPDSDPERLKQVMENIATSARTSLGDVRRVLRPDEYEPVRQSSIDGLTRGLADAGRAVERVVSGVPRPLPPDREVVAERILQEMLTNALRHGDLADPITVNEDWRDGLRLEVRNRVGTPQPGTGRGVPGMRSRLDSVGGRLQTRLVDGWFVATAWFPTGVSDATHEEHR